ncbi:argininosuccinate synthase [Vibrio mediterranei AK1]|nr:argininosuccinate synthase [Vibrio mediterranei AK1]
MNFYFIFDSICRKLNPNNKETELHQIQAEQSSED